MHAWSGLCALALAGCLGACANDSEAPQPSFRIRECPFDTSSWSTRLVCGTVKVPESRTGASARSIELSVVRALPLEGGKSQVRPGFFLAGGPGESGIASFASWLENPRTSRPLLARREWVVIDQRGTGFSRPRLACNGIFELDSLTDGALFALRARRCAEQLSPDAELSAYTTEENAADVADVAEALELDEYDIFGISYGGVLAQAVLRDHPAGVHAVVLDSPGPLDRSALSADVEAKWQATRALLAACSKNKTCALAYPDLDSTLNHVLERANARPVDLGGVKVDGTVLAFLLTNTAFLQRPNAERLPQALSAADGGDFELLGSLITGVFLQNEGDEGPVARTSQNDGMNLAVYCHEDARFVSERLLSEYRDRDALGRALVHATERYLDACEAFRGSASAMAPPSPARSSVPVLFLRGEIDAATPADAAAHIVRTLPRAQVLTFPGQGHSVAENSLCAASLIDAFLLAPGSALDSRCIEETYPELSFATQ